MKKTFFIIAIVFITIGLSGCEKCETCNCTTQLSSGSSVNCYGKTQSGSGCDNNTLNSCGYCYLHTDQCCN